MWYMMCDLWCGEQRILIYKIFSKIVNFLFWFDIHWMKKKILIQFYWCQHWNIVIVTHGRASVRTLACKLFIQMAFCGNCIFLQQMVRKVATPQWLKVSMALIVIKIWLLIVITCAWRAIRMCPWRESCWWRNPTHNRRSVSSLSLSVYFLATNCCNKHTWFVNSYE